MGSTVGSTERMIKYVFKLIVTKAKIAHFFNPFQSSFSLKYSRIVLVLLCVCVCVYNLTPETWKISFEQKKVFVVRNLGLGYCPV